MKTMHQNKTVKTLGFLIFPGFSMAGLTSAIEPLRAANEIAGQKAFSWSLIAETEAPVTSSAEVNFDPDVTLEQAEELDYLFLLSGPLGRFEKPKSANGKLRWLARRGVRMGGVSGGVFPLARAGLMDGHRCSLHWCYEAAFKSEFPQIETTDHVIAIDRRRYTVSGAAAVFELMLKLIVDKLGAEIMTEVACWFQHPLVRGEDVSQKVPALKTAGTGDTLPKHLKSAIRLFSEHIEDPIRITDVAEAVTLSPRQLERSFKRYTGQSPLAYYRMLRMKAARQLVLYSNDSMTGIAIAVGYFSAPPMVRHYKLAFGILPQEERRKINTFRVSDNAPIPSA